MAHTTNVSHPDTRAVLRAAWDHIAAFFARLGELSSPRHELLAVARMNDAELNAHGYNRAALTRAIISSRGMY